MMHATWLLVLCASCLPPELVQSENRESELKGESSNMRMQNAKNQAGQIPPQLEAFATKAERIRSLVSEYHALDRFHGCVLVAEHGKLIVNLGIGLANRSLRTPFTPNTSLRLGSITKAMTAVLVHQQIEAGRLSLETLVAPLLPNFRPDLLEGVSIRHLLEHSSGVPYADIDFSNHSKYHEVFELDGLMDYLANQIGPRVEQPGTRFQYSNTGYRLLAALLVRVTGIPYPELLRRQILEPAGMTQTGCERFPQIMYGASQNYHSDRFGGWVRSQACNMTSGLGAGDVYSTAEDLFRFDRALHTGLLLSNASRKLMTTRALGPYGLGWEVPDVDEAKRMRSGGGPATVVFHSGGIQGTFTHFVRYLEDEHVVIVLSNVTHDPYEGPPLQMAQQIGNIIYEQPVVHPQEGVRDKLYRLLKDEGVEAAAAFHRQERASQAATTRDFEPNRACGPPDALDENTYSNAWFPAGSEVRSWLECRFDPVPSPRRLQLHGTQGQRALTQVELGTSHGSWIVVPWKPEVTSRLLAGLGVTESPIEVDDVIESVRLTFDNALVNGVNVVDAIAIIDSRGASSWAKTAYASDSRASTSHPASTQLPDRSQMLALGMHLMTLSHEAAAARIFEFVIEVFGEYAGAFAGLASAQRAMGELEQARNSARSALVADPSCAAAQAVLDGLPN